MNRKPYFPPAIGSPIYRAQPEQKMENFQGGYNESRPKRIREIVEHYGAENLRGKTMLEVGAGYGHIGATFVDDYGVDVLCTDARPEYVEMIKQKHPQVRAEVQDLEHPWPFTEKFDFVLHMGVLHHIHPNHVPTMLEELCNAGDDIVLEHQVEDVEDDQYCAGEGEPAYDQSIHKMGCRPSTMYIERVLAELGMQSERLTDPRINGPANFTWETGHAPAHPRRFWFVWK